MPHLNTRSHLVNSCDCLPAGDVNYQVRDVDNDSAHLQRLLCCCGGGRKLFKIFSSRKWPTVLVGFTKPNSSVLFIMAGR